MSLRIPVTLLVAMALSWTSTAVAAGARVSGVAVVVARDPQGSEVARFQTDARGEFTLTELSPGRYTIFISSLGIERAKARSGIWIVELLATGGGKEPLSSKAVIYTTREVSGGLQAVLTVPPGPPKSFKGVLSH